MRILMATAELWPLAKVGGLADMVGSLARALGALGHDVRCVMPWYRGIEERLPPDVREVRRSEVHLQVRGNATGVRLSEFQHPDLPATIVLASHKVFDRAGIYEDPVTRLGYPDNGLRWTILCRAVHAALGAEDAWIPEIVHGHDHQAALLPALLRWGPRRHPPRGRPAAVFTIHNLGYQGIEPRSFVEDSGLPAGLAFLAGPLEFHGKVNLMKLGIEAADWITTVSPRYADEIQTSAEFGMGLEGVVASKASRLVGILNGIDTHEWNPATDPHLPFRYSLGHTANKERITAALRQELGLISPDVRTPLIGMVSRLVPQKGLDLLLPVLDAILGNGIELAILGAGKKEYEKSLAEAESRHPGRIAFRTGHEEGLAHRIEAGADMFLMPSRYEPCGLNQMYSLRYGTVPLVRAVGGLADTVVDLDEDPERANGFVFRCYEPVEMLKTVRRAARAWQDRKLWRGLMARGMAADFCWDASARRYVDVYEQALQDRV